MFAAIGENELYTAEAEGLLTPSAVQWAVNHMAYLNSPMRLFGSSTKVEKGAEKRETYVMYLQPADKVAADTLCPVAEAAGCKGPCLIDSGQLGMTVGQNAATKRTVLFLLRREWFEGQLSREIDAALRKHARGNSARPLFRLNGTSDINWLAFIQRHAEAEFYDYTKSLSYARKGNRLPNYDVTYSASMASEAMQRTMVKALQARQRVAVAVNTSLIASDAPILASVYRTFTSFDDTDLRPLDHPRDIGVLSRKGSNKAERARENAHAYSFFVTETNVRRFTSLVAEGLAAS